MRVKRGSCAGASPPARRKASLFSATKPGNQALGQARKQQKR
ncbi:MAG: hypothetical protein ACPGR8_08545 [Limisphaerales bacterium]